MVDTLKVRTFSYRQRWGDAAEPAPMVERSNQLNEHLRMRDSIGEQLETARTTITTRIDALLESHGRSGLVRTGATLKAGIAIFADHAGYLIDNLIAAIPPQLRGRETFELVENAFASLLGFIDAQLKRIVATIEHETQDRTLARRYEDAALRVWGEERAAVLGRLELHRAAFLVPAPTVAAPEEAEAFDEEQDLAMADAMTETVTGTMVEPMEEPTGCEEQAFDNAPQEDADALPAADAHEETCAAPSGDLPGEVWAELAVDLWTGKIANRTRADLEDGLRHALARAGHTTEHDAAGIAARQVWDRYIARNHVLSSLDTGTAGASTQCDLRVRAPGTFLRDSAGLAASRDHGTLFALATCQPLSRHEECAPDTVAANGNGRDCALIDRSGFAIRAPALDLA